MIFHVILPVSPSIFFRSIFDSLRLVMSLRYWAVKAIVPSFVQTEMIIWTGHHDDNLYTTFMRISETPLPMYNIHIISYFERSIGRWYSCNSITFRYFTLCRISRQRLNIE